MHFSNDVGNESLNYEYPHPAELDQRIGNKAYDVAVAICIATTRVGMSEAAGLRPNPELGEFAGDVSPTNLAVVMAANHFKCAPDLTRSGKLGRRAAELYVTGMYPDRQTWSGLTYEYSELELYRGLYDRAVTLIGNMQGSQANQPARQRTAIIFVDNEYHEAAHRAFSHAFLVHGQGKTFDMVPVLLRTEQFETEDVA